MNRFKTGDKVVTPFTGNRVCTVKRSFFLRCCERLDLEIPFANGDGSYIKTNVLHSMVRPYFGEKKR